MPAFYYDALAGGAARLDIWETDYMHVLDGPEAIVDWYRGTGLRPFLNALPETDRAAFLAEYLERDPPRLSAARGRPDTLPFPPIVPDRI